LAEQLLQPHRILKTWNLHENAIGSLALDRGLHRAQLIDSPLDDLNRLIDRLTDAFVERWLADGETDQPAPEISDLHAALARAAENPAERLREFAQFCHRLLPVGAFAQAHFDGVAARYETGVRHARLAQHAPHVIAQSLDLFLA